MTTASYSDVFDPYGQNILTTTNAKMTSHGYNLNFPTVSAGAWQGMIGTPNEQKTETIRVIFSNREDLWLTGVTHIAPSALHGSPFLIVVRENGLTHEFNQNFVTEIIRHQESKEEQ